MRTGSPLFDISGYVAAVPRTLTEKAAQGGSISLLSQGDLILNSGSLLDVSGGGYSYAPGALATTQLISAGKIYSIGAASPNIEYNGVLTGSYSVTDSKWGVTRTYPTLISQVMPYQPGYVEGKSAGSITLDGTSMVLDGAMRATVKAGPYQTASGGTMPAYGQLTIGIADSLRSNLYLLDDVIITGDHTPVAMNLGPNDPIPVDAVGSLQLPMSIFAPASVDGQTWIQGGFGKVFIGANDSISLPSGLSLSLPVEGSLTLAANQISIAGQISAPSGNIQLSATNLPGSGSVQLSAGAQLSVAGSWVNDRLGVLTREAAAPLPHVIDGGSIVISSNFSVDLGSNSQIDVSGGANLTTSGTLLSANAGSIMIQAGSASGNSYSGQIISGARFLGYSAAKGGSLELDATRVLIGGSSDDPQTFVLQPEFFQQGGFSTYKIGGFMGVTLADGTSIHPLADSYVIDLARALATPSGGNVGGLARVQRLPLEQRNPTNISLTVGGNQTAGGSGLLIGTGSEISADPGASVTLTSHSALDVDGTINVPAGSIALTVTTDLPGPLAMHLGDHSRLISEGYFRPQPNNQGLQLGQVLRAGQITLTGAGDVIADAGSLIDVSGVSATVQSPVQSGRGVLFVPNTLHGDAGVISVSSGGVANLAGEMRGSAAAGAAGGTFTLDLSSISLGSPSRIVLSAGGTPPVAAIR
jgi:filamentous hemagglutinin